MGRPRAQTDAFTPLTVNGRIGLVPIGFGMYAKVDLHDLPIVFHFRWHARHAPRAIYAARNALAGEKSGTIFMHRILTECPSGMFVDHVNHDGLDNTRSNLRVVTRKQNNRNRQKSVGASSRHPGVSYDADSRKWRAVFFRDGRRFDGGRFHIEAEAAIAAQSILQQLKRQGLHT